MAMTLQSAVPPTSLSSMASITALGAAELAAGLKREQMSPEEGAKKVRRTIGWYNHNGGLAGPIIYKNIRDTIEAINPREALKILKGLEDKGTTIRNPTAWVQRAAERVGPELDIKVKKTIAWYNKHGGLSEEIRYDEVRGLFACMQPKDACHLLKSLDGKGNTIRVPTAYLCKAAQKKLDQEGGGAGHWVQAPGQLWAGYGEVSDKVRRTIGWYNRNGNLQQEIRYNEVAPALSQIGEQAALQILKGLDGKGHLIRNPTAWITSAAHKLLR